MGRYNSSLTRVQPVFDELWTRDSTGESWLRDLLSLPICGHALSMDGHDFAIKQHFWAPIERKLNPPVSLLSWLIRHPEKLHLSKGAHSRNLRSERRALLYGSEDRMIEALALLRDNPHGKSWHIFEGETQPDVFIATASLVVVVEGKRTEIEPTTHTDWMPGRRQMLRHIDCAWEICGGKKVVGFFMVEANPGREDVPTRWQEFARKTVSADAIASSLPHRGPEEQSAIAGCFAGVTTSQRVCREFCIDVPPEISESLTG